jgi:hypothetical protein
MSWLWRLLGITNRIWNLNVEYMELSGLIVHWGLGHPPEEMHFALDFKSSKAVIYIASECPPFVPCYEAGFQLTHPDESLLGSTVSTFVWAGAATFFRNVDFQIVRPPDTVVFRDVGGVVGCNPFSTFLEGKTMRLSLASNSEIQMNIIHGGSNNGSPVYEWMASTSKDQWEVKGGLDGQRTKIVLDFTLGPQELILPNESCALSRHEYTLQFRSQTISVGRPESIRCIGSSCDRSSVVNTC